MHGNLWWRTPYSEQNNQLKQFVVILLIVVLIGSTKKLANGERRRKSIPYWNVRLVGDTSRLRLVILILFSL